MKGFKNWFSLKKVPEMSVSELKALMETSSPQLIDVRSSVEWRNSRIKEAVNLPIHRFNEDNVDRLSLDKSTPIVLICLSAHRRIPAVRFLHSLGFSNAVQLKGGMKQWWKSKGSTVSGRAF